MQKRVYTINIGDFTVGETVYHDRCLSASFGGSGVRSETIPWKDTEYNPWDYKYENEEFLLDPIAIPEPEEPVDRLQELEDAIVELAALMGG